MKLTRSRKPWYFAVKSPFIGDWQERRFATSEQRDRVVALLKAKFPDQEVRTGMEYGTIRL